MTNYIVLSSQYEGLQLPVANSGNTIQPVSDLTVKKTMTGKTFTYLKQSNKELIKYHLTLTRVQNNTLQSFLLQYGSELLILVDWHEVQWGGYLTNEPWSFTQHKNWTDIELVFEGVRL